MLTSSTIIIFGKLLLAAVLGMFLGTERLAAGKNAGTRTFALVALGSCVFTVTGTVVDQSFLGVVNFDPLRLAAGIVQGIGFLGAGLIILRENALHGLTTATGLWIAAAVGIAVGFGLYAIAVFSTFLTVFIFAYVWRFENWARRFFIAHEPVVVARNYEDGDENGVPDVQETTFEGR